ncbi:MAG: hypothetical protein PHI05_01895 [Bacilli bacterium]|nr:hypothetical protein [Bacilli bacterium]MDD4547481.1 hypothetical protein [Bacilli bacterium]
MNINYSIALAIREKLNKRIFNENIKDLTFFLHEELDKVEELEITNADNLNDIDKLPNLKKIVIKSANSSDFASYMDLEMSPLLNHIKNFTKIEKLQNLEELSIINDININKIDVSKLKNLTKLVLVNNPNLTNITGLDELKNLDEIIIYGTNAKNSFDLEKYIVNTFRTKVNILDINMYNNIVKGSIKNSTVLSNLYKLKYTNLKFAEKTGFADFALLDPIKVDQLYQKCSTLIRLKKLNRLSNFSKVKQVYKYVTMNTSFDNDGIIERDRLYLKEKHEQNGMSPALRNKFSIIHSSYNAGVLKRANCEGYVNLMNFMLRMLDVETASVYATDKKNKYFASYNHALTSVKIDGKWYYCEPTWEKPGEFKYFMKTYDEINETHVVNPIELLKNRSAKVNVNYNSRNRQVRL